MLQNGNSKKMRSHFPLQVAFMLLVFIIFSFFYNEINIQKQQQKQPLLNEDDVIGGDGVAKVQQKLSSEEGISKGTDDDEEGEEDNFPQPAALVKQTLLPQTSRAPLEPLDKSSTCTWTKEYTGRRVLGNDAISTRREDPGDGGFNGEEEEEREGEECDFFSGRWVYDNTSYPLYNWQDCPYMSDQLACLKHGRPDSEYQHWRWQPHNCNLKRWNATEMWEKLRGKRLMFVGDSLNRGQWLSMVCLLQMVIPADKRLMTPQAHLSSFHAEEYNSSIEFLWAPLLVESNSDHPVEHRVPQRIIRPDSTLRHSSQWKNADIVVFNSYVWWTQGPVNISWSDGESGACEEIGGMGGMELALEALTNWMALNFDYTNKRAFFMTMSPTHYEKERWDPANEGNCYGETLPILKSHFKSGIHLPTMEIVNKVVRKMNPKIQILNITQLADYRKDGHPSSYRKFWEKLNPQANPADYSDCLHWCLPGVQDVWNQILFQYF
ncbi:OLC1v1015973C1 [Oldenlandia corymbosa var. corymbosa]|uniref:OLC1v1015973C1 n=1 Tax=Oldenlandia corymbosa var. corymbosa TaxID=529605 RepID=A0AAV1E4Q7_OLDCO|nr:OLC1v1015973C1 [Oldenlandia corymbosa var. corymbosa]